MATTTSTNETKVTCTRCAGSGTFPRFPMRCNLCNGSGERPTRSAVIAANKANRLELAEAYARHDRLMAAGIAAAEAHADADGRAPLSDFGSIVRPVVSDLLDGYEPDVNFQARRRPIMFAAVVAAVAGELAR